MCISLLTQNVEQPINSWLTNRICWYFMLINDQKQTHTQCKFQTVKQLSEAKSFTASPVKFITAAISVAD